MVPQTAWLQTFIKYHKYHKIAYRVIPCQHSQALLEDMYKYMNKEESKLYAQ